MTVAPQVWFSSPALTVKKVWLPETSTGTRLGLVVPSPSWPLTLCPQQCAAPDVVTPQVKENPALMEAKAWLPKTATGTSFSMVVPSPSWPLPLFPQQRAAPDVVTPQLWELAPALTDPKT